MNEHAHPTKVYSGLIEDRHNRELVVPTPSQEGLEMCSAVKKYWWHQEYLKNGLVLFEAKFLNSHFLMEKSNHSKKVCITRWPNLLRVPPMSKRVWNSLITSHFFQNMYHDLQSNTVLRKITWWVREKAMEGWAPKLWKSLILVTWNHMGIETQQDWNRKREGELVSSLEWNDMSQTNTWPRSFIIVGVISELKGKSSKCWCGGLALLLHGA